MNLDSDLFPILGNPSSVLRGKGQHPAAESGNLAIRRLLALAILIVGAAIPAWIAGVLARAPQTRDIRVEAYRYGFSPARIRANRGDRLRFTFSTRDTGQSFFFQDYDLHVSITPGNKMVSVQRLSHPDDPPALMETVEIVAGLPGWQGWLGFKTQFWNSYLQRPVAWNRAGGTNRQPQFPPLRSPGAVGRHSVRRIAGDWPPHRRRKRSPPAQLVRTASLAQASREGPFLSIQPGSPDVGGILVDHPDRPVRHQGCRTQRGPDDHMGSLALGADHPAGAHRGQSLVHGLSSPAAVGVVATPTPYPKSGGVGKQIPTPDIRRAADLARLAQQRMAARAAFPTVGNL